MKKALLLSTLVSATLFAVVPPLKPVSARTFSQSQYIPDISLIADFSYVNRNIEDAELQHLQIPGIGTSHGHEDHSHAAGYNANNGFNLNYAELVLSSSVDPFFNMDAVFHFSENGVEIEEAYFTSTVLGGGMRLRGGKLLSEFGHQNSQHHHFWDFGDMPLVYEAFLGSHGINELGVQLQWVAPIEQYLMVGAEVLQGTNESMFGNAQIGDIESDNGVIADAVRAPSLFVAYAKTSFDIGSSTILPGISYAYGSSRLDHMEEVEDPYAFAGNSALYGADLTAKHHFDSYSFLTWQSEWMMRNMDGTQYDVKPNESTTAISQTDFEKIQAGFYTQLVYAYNQNWRTGIRYDNIYQNDVTDQDLPDNLNRYTAMLEYHPSEFSRIRLQYGHNNSLFSEDGERQNIDTVILQFNIAIGAHGAHDF